MIIVRSLWVPCVCGSGQFVIQREDIDFARHQGHVRR